MRTSARLLLAGVVAALLLTACATPASRIQANPGAFARLTPSQQALVQAGQIALGFDPDGVKLALGDPDRISARTDAGGETIIWHFTTYESEGRVLYTGHYHTRRAWWGWGAAYPYYLDYPDRRVRERFRVEFSGGRVVAITRDLSP
jgi:hypothetical protein